MRKPLSLLLSLLLVLSAALPLTSCNTGSRETLRIGVVREDDTSGEAKAWEQYLRAVGSELGFSVDFTTTDSSSSEVSAINTYASKGYDGILLFSDDDLIASVGAAAAKKLYVVCPTGHPTDAQYEQLKSNAYYLGSVAPDSDTEFRAGYDMAKFFIEQKQQRGFTVFGGAALYGVDMHVQRLAGILACLCEDPTTTYDGVRDRASLVSRVSGKGIDPQKLVSDKYRIVAYMDGFAFDDAFTTKLTAGMENGGTCILSVGAGDAVTRIAYGIGQSNPRIGAFMSGGVDAITPDYAACFDLGYTYDCGKYPSAMAPGLTLLLSALRGAPVRTADGNAPRLSLSYWVADGKDKLGEMLASDDKESGYCYDAVVIDAVIRSCAAGSTADLEAMCTSDYAEARALRDRLHAASEGSGT